MTQSRKSPCRSCKVAFQNRLGNLTFIPSVLLGLLIGGLCSVQATARSLNPNAAHLPVCVELPPKPASFSTLAPRRQVRCKFGRFELATRFSTLLKARSIRLELEQVEQAFDLPRLSTSFPSARAAWYSIEIDGFTSAGEWKALLQYRESFYPLKESLPPRLSASKRPHALDPADRGSIAFFLDVIDPNYKPVTGPCRTGAWLRDQALEAGWKDETADAPFATDGGPKSAVLKRGNMTFSPGVATYHRTPTSDELNSCFNSVRIDQEATRPNL